MKEWRKGEGGGSRTRGGRVGKGWETEEKEEVKMGWAERERRKTHLIPIRSGLDEKNRC